MYRAHRCNNCEQLIPFEAFTDHKKACKCVVCSICCVLYPDEEALLEHHECQDDNCNPDQKENDKDEVKCRFCSNIFCNKILLIQHLQEHHIDEQLSIAGDAKKVYSCEVCDKRFGCWESWKFHIKHHDRIMCTLCSKSCTYRSFSKHLESCGKKVQVADLFKCDLCFLDVQRQNVYQHAARCHRNLIKNRLAINIKDYVKCNICSNNVIAGEYAAHFQSEVAKKLFINKKKQPEYCNKCDVSFGRKAISYHKIAHYTVEDFPDEEVTRFLPGHGCKNVQDEHYYCEFCDEEFDKVKDFYLHVEKEHFTEQCQLHESVTQKLPSSIKSRKQFEEISESLKNDQLNLCKTCGKIVKNTYAHNLIHHQLKSWLQCDVCHKTVYKTNAIRHAAECHQQLLTGMLKMSSNDAVECNRCKNIIPAHSYAMHFQKEVGKCLSSIWTKKCDDCDTRFANWTYHATAHTDANDYVISEKGLTNYWKVLKRKHSDDPNMPWKYTKIKDLKIKIQESKGTIQRDEIASKYPCSYCEVTALSAAFMQEHYAKVHDKIIPIYMERNDYEIADSPVGDQDGVVTDKIHRCFICGNSFVCPSAAHVCLKMCEKDAT